MNEPVVTEHSDGRLSVEYPNPPRPTYEMSAELIPLVVERINTIVDLRDFLTNIDGMDVAIEWINDRLSTETPA
jgi:hypothetical protein